MASIALENLCSMRNLIENTLGINDIATPAMCNINSTIAVLVYVDCVRQRAQIATRSITKARQHGGFREACAAFHAIQDEQTFAIVSRLFPHLKSYDEKGNYVGNVNHENGWTP